MWRKPDKNYIDPVKRNRISRRRLLEYIDVVLAERFRDQARKPTFMATWDEVILPEALDLIKLRLINMHVELGLTRDAADTWMPEGQTLLAVAETICDLFSKTNSYGDNGRD